MYRALYRKWRPATFDDVVGQPQVTDILKYQVGIFHKTLQEHSREKGRKIVFIHGKGDGVLRNAILHELNYRYKQYTHQDASFQEYGFGATQVTIR